MSYTDNQSSWLIFNSPDGQELKEHLIRTAGGLRNPYIDIYHWCKGEMYDILALQACIRSRTEVEAQLNEVVQKKKSTQETIDDMAAGKTTSSTLFKSKDDSVELQDKINRYTRDIETITKLLDVITCFIGDKVLKVYKMEKLGLFRRIMSQFTILEISNAHLLASFWSKLL